jgi:hypothetical protein
VASLRYIFITESWFMTTFLRTAGTVALVAALCLGTSSAVFADECSTPLPSDVTRPAQQATEGDAAFIGTWGNAKWDGNLCHTLVVEALASDSTATVVYSTGVYRPWKINAPSFGRYQGRIDKGTLHLDFSANKVRVEYRLIDGQLHGKYFIGNGVSTIVMPRIK